MIDMILDTSHPYSAYSKLSRVRCPVETMEVSSAMRPFSPRSRQLLQVTETVIYSGST